MTMLDKEGLKALEWAMDEIDALSNKLCGFAYPNAMPMVGREDQEGKYVAAVMARRASPLSHAAGDVAGLVETLRSPSVACPCREFRHEVAAALSAIQAENARMKARVKELEAALLPFARVADMEERAGPSASVMVNVARCRDARSTLAKEVGNVE